MPDTARTRRPGAPVDAPRLSRALGVTRVARVTGLDRTGVEVACAVRPGGHVLQVTNGKGLRFATAAAGALLEAAELAAAEAAPPARLAWASEAELVRERRAHLAPRELGGDACPTLRLAWREGVDLATGGRVLVPAALVHAPAQGGPVLGLAGVSWTSNGMGAHPSRPAALLHALLEAAERHGLARALPQAWTEDACAAYRLGAGLARCAPAASALARRIARRGFEVYLFRLPAAAGVPLAAALLFDARHGPVPLTAGYASRLDLDAAATAALLEAAQSRLTDIHGAREDVAPADPRGVERLRRACRAAARDRRPSAPERGLDPAPRPRPPPAGRRAGAGSPDRERALRAVLSGLRRAGFPRAVAVDLAPPDLGVHVVKVLVPGLLRSELL